MADVMDRGSIDAIAHHAVNSARRTADTRALPELRTPPRHWRTPAIALATVVIVVAGLTTIFHQRGEQAANAPASLEWLLREVPDGWRPVLTQDPVSPPPKIYSLPTDPITYATDSSPLGANLSVFGSTNADATITPGSFAVNALAYTEFDLDGRRAAFVDLLVGDRGLYVETDGTWAYLAATGVSDDDLVALARSLHADQTGRFDVDPDLLPDGMRKIALHPDSIPAGTSIRYQPPAGTEGSLSFSLAPSTGDFYARSSIGSRFEEITIGDTTGYINTTPADPAIDRPWLILWQHDGLDFAIYATNTTRDQAIAAARSASPATTAEWTQLIDAAALAPADTAVIGTTPTQTSDIERVCPHFG